MEDKVQLLINILLDKTAREDERDDAAMYLGTYRDKRALVVLTDIASDPNEVDDLVDDCAHSIGRISIDLNQFDEKLFNKMLLFAQDILFNYIMAHNPELIQKPLRIELAKKFNYPSI